MTDVKKTIKMQRITTEVARLLDVPEFQRFMGFVFKQGYLLQKTGDKDPVIAKERQSIQNFAQLIYDMLKKADADKALQTLNKGY